MRIRLIGKANGVGLSRDLELLGEALRAAGCEITQLACDRRERRRRRAWLTRVAARWRRPANPAPFDANIMLEHVWPQFLHQARCNVLVPNPEWFDRRDAAMLSLMDRVWCKTALSRQLFGERGCRVSDIGFDSEDRLAGEVAREPRFLHVGGRSELKGTSRLLALWRQHPEWPRLTVIQDAAAVTDDPGRSAGNIVIVSEFLDDAALRELQNAHRFHLCLSEAEGWGHYIVEALSVGAVTLTCDAAPMNQLVTAERGMLVPATPGAQHNLVRLAMFEPEALGRALSECLQMAPERFDAIGARARDWFVTNKHEFPARVRRALAELA